ncbi:MAG TPA: metallophosphoesterase [Kofleriaceae bacterium]|nr:metallophosphoesterase [Kofleriaceae bacterium]
MRATWLTDIHLNFMRPLALRAFYDRVRQERPDYLFVTGDIGEADSVGRFVEELGKIAPVYYVLGNHDYYRSGIHAVRERLPAGWLPAQSPVQLSEQTVLLGIDGWGDARCGDLESTIQLSDWQLIEDFEPVRYDRKARIQLLQELGTAEAFALGELLAKAPASDHLVVLTHVPPFPEACIYEGAQSDQAWLPWFTCIATGELLTEYASAHPQKRVTVLCGHSHGVGTYSPLPNLEVRTGGWPAGVDDYGNPIVQATLELA